jgi:hypothetical protein
MIQDVTFTKGAALHLDVRLVGGATFSLRSMERVVTNL